MIQLLACLAVLAGMSSMLLAQATELAAQPGQGDKPIRVLIIDGFSNHDWSHTTRLVREILQQTHRFTIDVATCPAKPTAPDFASFRPDLFKYDVVLLNCNDLGNGGAWPEALKNDFVKYVTEGGGVFVLHSANNAFADWEEYNRIIGLGWRNKSYGDALIIDANEKIVHIPPGQGESTGHGERTDRKIHRMGEHPIHQNMPRVWMTPKVEVYTHARGPAENLTVLSWAEDPKTQTRWPMEWTIGYGNGRVYNSVFGHVWKDENNPVNMRCAGFQTILVRALQWLAGRAVDFPIPADFPTADAVSLRDLQK